MGGYVPIEYPKWVGDVLVHNAAEEHAHRKALVEAAETARTPKPARLTSPAAIRMRRSRKRQREKLKVVPFEIRIDEINGLVTRGLLDPVARKTAMPLPMRWAGYLMPSRRNGGRFQQRDDHPRIAPISGWLAELRRWTVVRP